MSRSDREGGLQRAADELREKLGRFASRPRFNQEFEMAFDFYFGHEVGELQPTLSEVDFERFMEWFVYDYPMSNGHRLIEMFDLEHRAELSVQGRRLLRQWLQAHLTLFEVVGGDGETLRLADLLTGRLFEGVRLHGEPPARWSIFVGRPLSIGKGYGISGAFPFLPPAIKETLLDHLRGEYRRYRREHEGATVERFLRENGHFFNDLLSELEDEIAAAEMHEEGAYRLVYSQAIFDVRDVGKVNARLQAYDDIVQVRPGRLIWYDAGLEELPEATPEGATNRPKGRTSEAAVDRATDQEKDRLTDRTTKRTADRATERATEQAGRTLAEISFTNGRMQVHCWSRERLEVCKKLLDQRLKGLVRHLVDAYQEGLPSSNETAPVGSLRIGERADTNGHLGNGAPGEDAAARACEEFIESWLNKPQAALRHSTPARLAASPLGRVRVAELLKQMEYRQRSRFGERGDIAPRELRRRLGIDDETGYLFPLDQVPKVWNRDLEAAVIKELFQTGGPELTPEHLDSATWMWWNYCSLVTQVIRKPAAWAAALHSCIAFVENWPISQEEIAHQYRVSLSSVSTNSWKIIDQLYLNVFDDRYCVLQPITDVFRRLSTDSVEPQSLADDSFRGSLSAANHLRDHIAQVLASHVNLRQRAYAFYVSHVGSRRAAEWEEAFLDWYHFDWHVPVMGGRTLIESVLRSGDLSAPQNDMLAGWVGRHPSFYIVKGVDKSVDHGSENGHPRPTSKLTLVDLMDASEIPVDWLQLSTPVFPGDVLFARLVPVDGAMISIGPVIGFPPRYKEIFHQALLEDRALVERWNGTPLQWEEFRARYSERLYALALQGMADDGLDFFED